MSDFLANLVNRSLAPRPAVRPQLISLFEPLSADRAAIFPPDDQTQRPTTEKQIEPISDRVSQLESLWRASPERTVTAGTVQAPHALPPDQFRREQLEAQPSTLARSKETYVIGVRAESDKDQDRAAPPYDAHPTVRNEKSTGPIAREPEKKQSTDLVANTEMETAKPDARERHAARRQEYQDAPNAMSIPPVAHQPEKKRKRSSEVLANIETELTETIARDRRAARNIFPAREIQLAQLRPAPVTRIASRQPPDIPAPEPSINVTIGRVEVRATLPPAPSKTPRASAPILSLDEYLHQRAGGHRR